MDTKSVSIATVRSTASAADTRVSARRFLDDLAPAITAKGVEPVVLVVLDPVTNALRHGGGICALDLTSPAHTSRRPHMTAVRAVQTTTGRTALIPAAK
ncbi:hypothetical protein WJM95_34220 [Streptomyces sp. f51]|uniref:hypothetical protein n=1 Tax=Streptomyces sp. f51 TaxID=1827742 RepID=UPI0030D58658